MPAILIILQANIEICRILFLSLYLQILETQAGSEAE